MTAIGMRSCGQLLSRFGTPFADAAVSSHRASGDFLGEAKERQTATAVRLPTSHEGLSVLYLLCRRGQRKTALTIAGDRKQMSQKNERKAYE